MCDYIIHTIVDDFSNIEISDETDNEIEHTICIVVVFKDMYGNLHILRNADRTIYKYKPHDIYSPDFKFKKDIKKHLSSMEIDSKNITKVSHITNVENNHVYFVKLSSINNEVVKYDTNTNDFTRWHIHFNIGFNINDIVLRNDFISFTLNDLLTLYN